MMATEDSHASGLGGYTYFRGRGGQGLHRCANQAGHKTRVVPLVRSRSDADTRQWDQGQGSTH